MTGSYNITIFGLILHMIFIYIFGKYYQTFVKLYSALYMQIITELMIFIQVYITWIHTVNIILLERSHSQGSQV